MINRLSPLLLILCMVPALAGHAAHGMGNSPSPAPRDNLNLWYDHEARNWMQEALPIGNGHMGAMLFGGVTEERVQFNEESLWIGDEIDTGAYQNFGEFVIRFRGEVGGTNAAKVNNYRRELDLNRAVHRVSYERNGIHYTREAFASFPANIIALRFTADKPGAISAELGMTDAHGAKPKADGSCITAAGALPSHKYDGGRVWPALNYEAQLRVIPEGGTLRSGTNGIVAVENANSLIVLLGAGTDFQQDRTRNWRGTPPHKKVTACLDAAAKRNWADLLIEHERDYRRLFSRFELNLGGAPSPLPTNQRLLAYNEAKPDIGLEELLFQYGRYLMIASSREGGLPANLQGKWNNSNNPPWRCDYHTDVNVEMNYWLTGPANLPECFEPFAKWIDSIRDVRKEATRKAFNTHGWLMRGESGLFGGSTWNWVPGTSAWLLQNSYDHYRFTGDRDYLRTFAYPAMKEVCGHWLDVLKARPDGTLITPKSISPEQMHVQEEGVSFDQQLVWDLLTSTIEASEILGVDADLRAELISKRARLLAPKIGKWGQLQEWMTDRDNPKDHHRHISHLIAVHPGRQISPDATPELAAAARVSLTARGDDSTGWSTAWKISQWARLHDGAHAHKLFTYLIRPCGGTGMANEGGGLYANLFDACPPFQIDGNFGYTAGVCEMLAQSHTGDLLLLPALPSCWPTGSVRGLRARTGLTLDMDWQDGKVKAFKLLSAHPTPVRVRVNGALRTVTPEKIN